MRIVPVSLLILLAAATSTLAAPDAFDQARANAERAQEAFQRCHRFVGGWLAHADPKSGLIPRNLAGEKDFWYPWDNAADNYPFMVLTCAITDRPMFEGRMLDILRAETKLTSKLDRIPAAWCFSKQDFVPELATPERLMFGGAEYVKDGLLPLTEWLGPSPWSERMLGIMDDLWKHAPIDSKRGKIPSESQEVNGELMQALSRLHWMTGRKDYLDFACRLADYYLLDHPPTTAFDLLRFRDHGCETLSGLSEVYAAVVHARPDKAAQYKAPIHAMFDRCLEIGRNEHGLFYNGVNPKTGQVVIKGLCDTWGYTYNGIYTVYLLDRTPAYRDAVREVLSNLAGHYRNFAWGAPGVLADEYADSIEGAINLYNRERIRSTADWIDSEIRVMWAIQKPDGVIEGWHGDGNFARTSIMYALWKTQGLTVRPWRKDVRLGAALADGRLHVTLSADAPWSGTLLFDRPRHREYLHLPLDYPRINQFPEWYTVKSTGRYGVQMGESDPVLYDGKALVAGVPVEIKAAKQEVRLRVTE